MKLINLNELFTIQETALETKKSEGLLRKRIYEIKLQSIKVGHSVLIPREEVDRLKKEVRP